MNAASARVAAEHFPDQICDGQSREFRTSGGRDLLPRSCWRCSYSSTSSSAHVRDLRESGRVGCLCVVAAVHDGRALHTLWLGRRDAHIYFQGGACDPCGTHYQARDPDRRFSNSFGQGEKLNPGGDRAATLRLTSVRLHTVSMVLGALSAVAGQGVRRESRTQIGWLIVRRLTFGTSAHSLTCVPTAYTLLSVHVATSMRMAWMAPPLAVHPSPQAGHADEKGARLLKGARLEFS